MGKAFVGQAVLDPTPMGHAAMERFCRCYSEYRAKDASFMGPALHGTDTRNYTSIFQDGLVIPGQGNNINVAHGSAFGLGVYTAKLNSPWLSQDFSTQPSMLVCCVIDDAHADLLEEEGQTRSCHPGYPLPFRKAKSSKDNGK